MPWTYMLKVACLSPLKNLAYDDFPLPNPFVATFSGTFHRRRQPRTNGKTKSCRKKNPFKPGNSSLPQTQPNIAHMPLSHMGSLNWAPISPTPWFWGMFKL